MANTKHDLLTLRSVAEKACLQAAEQRTVATLFRPGDAQLALTPQLFLDLLDEIDRLKTEAVVGWESTRLLAIAHLAHASERAADVALAKLKE